MRILDRSVVLGGLVLMSCISTPAFASSTNGYGSIKGVTGTYNGALLFNVDLTFYSTETKSRRATATRDAPPACGAGQPNRWAIDASTPAGQAAASALLWALGQHKLISVTGSGKCSIWPDVETVATFTIED